MKVYRGDTPQWYVHIGSYYGLDGVHYMFRGDSDPKLMCSGRMLDYYDWDDYMHEAYEEEHNDGETFEQFVHDNAELLYMGFFECSDKDSKTNRGNSNKHKIYTMKMNDNQKRVLKLAKSLIDVSEYVEANKESLSQRDYDAHHANRFTISQCVEEYQVLRMFDVEIEPTDPADLATDEEMAKMHKEEEEHGYYDDAWGELLMRLEEDGIDPYFDYEYEEVVQFWINTNTNELVMLGKVFDSNPSCCDFDKDEWECISLTTMSGRHYEFRRTFYEEFGSCHYMDLSVHPLLQSRGYTGIDATGWYYGCGEDDNYIPEAKFFKAVWHHEGWLTFLQNIVDGSQWERTLKQYTLATCIEAYNFDENHVDEYLTAIKICRRQGYEPADCGLWEDMLHSLIYLQKDLHNPFYVCPNNLQESHDKYTKMEQNKREKERKLAKERRLKEALVQEQMQRERYLAHVAPYLSVVLGTKNYRITVCPTPEEMVAEGKALHHCVGGYWRNIKNNLILFVRNPKTDERISTVEIRHDGGMKWSIVQNRGLQNGVPRYFNAVNKYLQNHFSAFTMAYNAYMEEKRKEEKAMKKLAKAALEQAQPIALAA